MRLKILFICLLATLAGCAAPTLKQEVLMPAPAAEVTTLKRIAVGRFDNDPSGVVRTSTESALAGVVLREKPYFTVVDGSAILKYMDVGKNGRPLDSAQAKKLGRNAGANGIVVGAVTANSWGDTGYTESRMRCRPVGKKTVCSPGDTYNVNCTKRTAVFSFTPRVVNVGTGEIVVAQPFSSTAEDSACSDAGTPLAGGPALLDVARNDAIKAFRNHVAPHYETINIALVTDDDSEIPPPVKAQVASGADFAKQHRSDRACALWREAYAAHQAGYALPYLNGLCAEVEGDLKEALRLYTLADQRCSKPVPAVNGALTRVNTTMKNIKKLDRQIK